MAHSGMAQPGMAQPIGQGTTAVRSRASHLDAYDVLTFMIPCLMFVRINAVGVLNGSDLVLLFAFIYLAFRGELRVSSPTAKRFVLLGSLWLASQIVTDIVRRSAFVDYARGWSNIGLTLVNFAVICTLVYGRWRRIVLYGWGIVAGSLLSYFTLREDSAAASDPWKVIFSFPVTLAVFLIASRKDFRGHWPITLSALIGIVNLGLGYRSEGGFCLAAALYLLMARSLQRKYAGKSKLKLRTVAVIAASLIAGVLGVYWVYGYAAATGLLGADARTKFAAQASGKYGVLLGGRSQLLGSIPAIYDSPILGHGSWAKDLKYLIIERRALALLGYRNAEDFPRQDVVSGIIQTHSYFFGAWVDAGILGAIFWAWVWVMVLKVLIRVYPAKFVLPAIVPWMAFELLWAIVFSPYGVGARIVVPYYIVIFMGYRSIKSHMAVPSKARMTATRIQTA
jgi:hypothetical protein